jgi:hypothetical protein
MLDVLAAAAIAGCSQVTTQNGATFTTTLSAAAGANCNQPWYLIVLNRSTNPQTVIATASGNGPGTVTLTIPNSALDAATCSVNVQTDVRFGGNSHGTTVRLPGSLKVTVTKPGACVKGPSPSPSPSVLPSIASRPPGKPPATTPAKVLGEQVSRPSTLPFTGFPFEVAAVAAGALTAAGIGFRVASRRR